jgi:hypothetical protein
MSKFSFFVSKSISLVAIISIFTSIIFLVHVYDRQTKSRRNLNDVSNHFKTNSTYDNKTFDYDRKGHNFSSQESLAELYYHNQLSERGLDQNNSLFRNLASNFPCVYGVNPVGTNSLQSIQDGIYVYTLHYTLCMYP